MKAKSQVSLYASWGHLILKMHHSTTRQAKQKISTNHDHHWSKKCSFLYVQTNCVCPSETQRFCKNDSDSSHRLWLVSNRVILCKTWLESSHHFSQSDSSRVRVTKSRDSSRVIDSSHAITANKVTYFTKRFQSIFTVGVWRMYPFNLPLLALPTYQHRVWKVLILKSGPGRSLKHHKPNIHFWSTILVRMPNFSREWK